MTKYKITGTFTVIMEDIDEENAVEQCMTNYLGALSDDYDDCFKSVEFEFGDVE